MSKTRFTQWIVLACIGSLAACTSGEGDTAGNTEFNVIVPNNESAPGVPAPIDIQTVEYTINCAGNNDTFLDNSASFPDEVVINGNLEVVDGRTSGAPPVPTEIWQGFMDLPPGPCTVQLRARDNDGEVICTATEPFNIAADTTTKVNMVLICDVSYQAPVGMLDVDATFSFNVGNFCPDLFVLNCLESNPPTLTDPFGIGVDLAITQCETRFRDGDSTCGNNCDPQTCVPTPEGLTCAPGPDTGVTTTVTCPGAVIDCDGLPNLPDPIGGQDTSCTYNGDTTGTIGGGEGTFFAACIPPAFGGTPGAVVTCTAVTTDGDIDCDKTKEVSFTCPGLAPCVAAGCTPGLDCALCDDGQQCTSDICDDSGGTAQCPNAPIADGTACTDAPSGSGLGICLAGVCDPQGCSVTGCDDSNECTVPQTCNVVTELCEPDPAANEPLGTSCAGGTGECDGAGTCVDVCVGVDCSDGNECTQDVGTSGGGVCTCSNPPEPAGTTCNAGAGTCDGAGACETIIPFSFPATSNAIDMCCNNNALPQQSIIPIQLDIGPISGNVGGTFNATLGGLLQFPESFLDVAQTVVVGGLQVADLLVGQVTVQPRSGVSGPNVAIPPIYPAGTCLISGACDVANNVPGNGNTDCVPQGAFNPCQQLVTIPTTASLATCLSLDPVPCTPGTDCTKSDQHTLNGFCVIGPLDIPLDPQVGTYTAGASGETMLFGWQDVGVPGTTVVGGVVTVGTPVFSDPVGPNGLKVVAGGALSVAIECIMAVETGDLLTDPVTCGSSPDAALTSYLLP